MSKLKIIVFRQLVGTKHYLFTHKTILIINFLHELRYVSFLTCNEGNGKLL